MFVYLTVQDAGPDVRERDSPDRLPPEQQAPHHLRRVRPQAGEPSQVGTAASGSLDCSLQAGRGEAVSRAETAMTTLYIEIFAFYTVASLSTAFKSFTQEIRQ